MPPPTCHRRLPPCPRRPCGQLPTPQPQRFSPTAMRLPSQPFNPPPGGSQTQGQRQRRGETTRLPPPPPPPCRPGPDEQLPCRAAATAMQSLSPSVARCAGLLPARWAVESTAIVIVVGVVLASTIVPGCDEAAAAWTALGSATAAEAAVTAAAWYWAWACSKKSSMPAMSMLALLLIQLASGACNLKKIWLQHSCSLPSSFLDPVLQSGLPVMSTGKLAWPWLSHSSLPRFQAWRSGCARVHALAPAAAQIHPNRCKPNALCVHCSVHALQRYPTQSRWPPGRGGQVRPAGAGAANCCKVWCTRPRSPLLPSASGPLGQPLPSPPLRG